ncbi:MAG TPA: chloride channel protein [Daejeonella sp.]|nr:chloride channel protein [Daejeonella sp.]
MSKLTLVLHWLRNNLSRNQFLILSGILVGCTAGLAGVVLKMLVHYIHYIITSKVYFEEQLIYYILFPFLGITLTSLMVIYLFKGQDRKGIPAILYEIAQNSSLVSSVKMYSQVLQSAVTVGLGGSAGLESPIAVTGSAIGSNFAKTYKLDYKERTLLLAAGAAAGIASAFNAPVAGMMFAFEILLVGVVFSDFIPLVVAVVCGSLISKIILNEETLFQFQSRQVFNYLNIPFYLVLGLICGLYARYFVVVAQRVEHFFKALQVSRLQKAMLGGALLSVLCMLLPPLFGEGYQTVRELAQGNVKSTIQLSFLKYFDYKEWFTLLFLGLVCIFKAFATSITINSGGNGGNFAPSLVSGGTLGYFFAILCVQIGIPNVPVTNLVIVGMAGVMSGVLYAPLTAIFLIAESSSGYDLLIPLMIVSVSSYLIAKWFSPVSPDLKKLSEEGKIFTREHDQNLLSLLSTPDLIDTDVQTINSGASFADLIELIKKGKRNIIGVLDGEKLSGVITLDDIRPLMFNQEVSPSLSVQELMKAAPAIIDIRDDMRYIIKKFDETNTWNLPVLDKDIFVGFISKSKVLNQYRTLLKEYSG